MTTISFAQGQPSYAIVATIKPNLLPLNSTVTVTACMSNEGTAASISVPVGSIQMFNIDAGLGTANAVSLPTVDNPATGVGLTPITATDFTVTQGSGNPNKIMFNYVAASARDWAARVHVCADITILTSAAAIGQGVRFSGNLSVLFGQVPFITVNVGSNADAMYNAVVKDSITSPKLSASGEFFGANSDPGAYDTGNDQFAVALGNNSKVEMSEATCVGGNSDCQNNSYFDNGNNGSFGGPSTGVGYGIKAFGTNIGSFTVTKSAEAFAGGNHSEAWGLASFAVGDGAKAMGRNSGNPFGPFNGSESLFGVDAGFADGQFNFWFGGGAGGIDHDNVLAIAAYGNNCCVYTQHSGSISTMSHQAIIGASLDGNVGIGGLWHWWFGDGVANTVPHDIDWHATAGKGTDVAGASWSVAPGQSTGAATPASLTWQLSSGGASGSTPQANVDKVKLDGPTGNLILLNGTSVQLGAGGPTVSYGIVAPSGTCAAGSLFINSAGGAGSTFFVCEAGSWAAK